MGDLFLWPARDRCTRVRSAFASDRGVTPRLRTEKGGAPMAGKSEQVKGQAKEAVGSLIGNKDLEAEGKADRRAGEIKEKVGQAKDKAEEVIERVEHKAEEVIDKAK